MAQTLEIPRDQWQRFFDDFSQMHQGWHATIQVDDRQMGAQPLAVDLPLQGISLDPRGSEAGSIEIAVGESTDDFRQHLIEHPKRVRVEENPGADATVQIEAEDAPVTLVMLKIADQLPH